MTDRLDYLAEIAAIQRLKAAYFRFYDTQNWENWLGLFDEAGVLRADYGMMWAEQPAPPMELVGRQALREYVLSIGHTRRTVHHGHTPEIDLLSETEATGIWAMEDIIEYSDRRIHGHGHYHETYRKTDGQWRFATIHLRRLRLVMTEHPASDLLSRQAATSDG